MKMKIKGKLIIPLIAVLIAMFTLGITPGVVAESTETTVSISDELTYVPPTIPPTSSLEEEVEGMVSDLIGDDLQNSEESVRGFSKIMAGLLGSIKNVLNSMIKILQGIGGMLGNTGDGLFSGGLF